MTTEIVRTLTQNLSQQLNVRIVYSAYKAMHAIITPINSYAVKLHSLRDCTERSIIEFKPEN